jgi:hypothetical protein
MSDIQDEAYSELCDENARLKERFQKAKEWNQFSEIQIKNLQSIVEDQKRLLGRAAEMLETLGCKGPAVDELRRAAQ